ncbi:MAG: DinB family protein [Boseongicola sp.]
MSTVENPWLKMALNNAWANATLYAALKELPNSAFTAKRPGFFSSLANTMNHIYEVDLYYLDALEAGGAGRSVYDRVDVGNTDELAALQSAADMRFAQFCNSITTETLAASRLTARLDGDKEETVAALILHLVQHQIHHRGQAHVQLSDAGESPPQLDDFYLEYGRVPSAQAYW